MEQPENYYSLPGIAKGSTDMEVLLAYKLLVENLRSKASPDTEALDQQRMALLDLALHSLLRPEKKKRHDEKLDWFVAKARLQADRARVEAEAAERFRQLREERLPFQDTAPPLPQDEQDHPELNPGRRDDLIAFVAARMQVTQRMLENHRNKDQSQSPAAPVLDKGEHPGYDPKCRWVTPEQWSCK